MPNHHFIIIYKLLTSGDARIAAVACRLACTGDDGCGSTEVAVFQQLYDGDWLWPVNQRAGPSDHQA